VHKIRVLNTYFRIFEIESIEIKQTLNYLSKDLTNFTSFFIIFRILNTSELTVQYLSPLVVRKEIENIILFKKQENQNESLIGSNFMDEHSVVFFNLLWYFKRIGTDSSYLLDILLNSRLNLLRTQFLKEKKLNELEAIKLEKSLLKKTTKSNILVRCMWDNLKLHNSIKTYETPLYLSWLNSGINRLKLSIKKFLKHLSLNRKSRYPKTNKTATNNRLNQ